MTSAVRLQLIVLTTSALVLCWQESRASYRAVGTLTGNIVRSEPGQTKPFISVLTVRLCSLDRVLQTETNGLHEFQFADVPPGTYDLTAANPHWAPLTVNGIEIEDGKSRTVTVSIGGQGAAGSICFRDSAQDCLATTYTVSYGERSPRKWGMLSGQVIDWQSTSRRKGIAEARISIFRAGETTPLELAVSDKVGRFQVSLKPGIYHLSTSHSRFQDAKVPDFLVPLENETEITIRTTKPGAIFLCQ